MTLNEIPTFAGFRSMAAFSVAIGDARQTFRMYASGERGKPSEYLQKVAQFAGLKIETIYFKSDAPQGSAQYWQDMANECQRMADQAKQG